MRTERHTAVVAENNDPESRGRIRVRCSGLLGSEDAIVQRWVEPCFDWGFFVVPDVDEQVEIECSAGSDLDESQGQAFLEEPNLRYRAKRFYGGDTSISEFFTEANYGKRRGFATPAGHVLMFDDTENKKKVNLAWHGVDNEYTMLSFDEDGSAIIANKNGSMVYMNAKEKQLAIIDEHGNSIKLADGEVSIVDKQSNIIKMTGSDMQLLAQNSMVVSGKAAQLDAGDALVGQSIAGPGSKASLNALTMLLGVGATLGIARLTDTVGAAAGMITWMTQVSGYINGLAPGTITPALPPDFGAITSASTKAKAE